MKLRAFGSTGVDVSGLGLGCSRLGSVLGADVKTAEVLLQTALDLGVSYFDTADIYGQGDSERLLGRTVANRPGAIICTKVGKRYALSKRLLIPLKAPIAAFARRANGAAAVVSRSRSQQVPTCFEPAYLERALHQSLRRLGVDRLDGVMLHSPAVEVIRRGDALATLAEFKSAGKVGFIGVSVDDLDAAHAAIADPRIQALQGPLQAMASPETKARFAGRF